ncbi:MAG: hypothetical protein MZU95_12120 [Desulfomicrobium escambiense]|nr:hypothetical protein [Desulfomicrobium escambiense]
MNALIRVDDLEIELRRSDRRRTVDLTVDRGGELVIAVPAAFRMRAWKRSSAHDWNGSTGRLATSSGCCIPRSPRSM